MYTKRKQIFSLALYRCSMWTLNLILYEPIWDTVYEEHAILTDLKIVL